MATTMRDVAQEAGVSVTTVSYVLTGRSDVTISRGTRERVFSAARRLQYRYNAHAADLRRGATRMVGVHVYSLGVPILARKVAALERELRAAGLSPFLCHGLDPAAQQSFFRECASRRVCGVVLTDRPPPDLHGDLEALRADGVLVVSAEPAPGLDLPYVTVDRRGGAITAMRHLLELGRRRIAVLVGFTGPAAVAFRDGCREALARRGLALDPALDVGLDPAPSNFAAGYRTAGRLLDLPSPPDALLTTDDEVAVGALRALRERGRRVPEEVALVGCDDLPLAAFAEIPLTTLAQPAEEEGARLAHLLVDGLRDPAAIAGCRVSLPMRLIIRASCGGQG